MDGPYKFYGRRYGRRLNASRKKALDEGIPKFGISLEDVTQISGPTWLEIGFGNGEHLAALAKQNPDITMIGCEPFINGVSALLKQIGEENIETVRIWPDDARPLMDALPDQSLDRCFVLHPDPWPKTRHHRRRFIQPETLDTLARLLKPGAELRLATDDPDLADWMLYHTWKHEAFEWTARQATDWQNRPADWPATRYGEKAIEGEPVYLIFRRHPA